MPTYEFRCPNGHDFERFFGRISEAPSEVACPECAEIATRRISGGAGLIFKGSGFYITDYGKDGKKDQRSSASGGSTTKSGDSKSGDSKAGAGKGSESKGSESGGGDGSVSSGSGGGSKSSEGGSGGDAGQSSPKPASPKPTAGE